MEKISKSRIGKHPVEIPAGVKVDVKENVITVTGPLGTLTQEFDNQRLNLTVETNKATFDVKEGHELEAKAYHGLYRVLLANMIVGVTKGFEKSLVISGVGWKVQQQGKDIVLNVGYSHPIEFKAPEGITLTCTAITEISVKGIDKVQVGQVASTIRSLRKPEPYHGYCIRYKDEVIERKEGKTAGK